MMSISRLMIVSALLAISSTISGAQASDVADSVFARAQRLVAEGRGDEGRQLVDKTLAKAAVGSPDYIGALYWRGVLAPTAAQAERDLRKVVVEYSLSAYGDDALLRLAQLEAARGDKARAQQHLEFLVREHAHSELRGRAQLALARLQFEAGNAPAACLGLSNAAGEAGAEDVELRNQIAFEQRKCVGVSVAATTQPPMDSSASPVVRNASDASSAAATVRQSPGDAATARQSATPPQSQAASTAGQAAAAATGQFTVQVGAFSTVEKARELQSELMARGYDARVLTGTLFRVRIGRYPSRERADHALERIRGSGIQGFVVEAEPR